MQKVRARVPKGTLASLFEKEVDVLLKELPSSERPVERLRRYGAGVLSTGELLTIIIGSPDPLGFDLLAHFGSLKALAQASLGEMEEIEWIGPSRAARIKAALELGRRLLFASFGERPRINSPADAANFLMAEMSMLPQEQMRVILLDGKNHILASPTIYQGTLNANSIRVGEVFREAIRENCAAIIVAHNHPSGDPTPSPEDIQATKQIVEAGKLLGIEVLDHLVIGAGRWVSLRERGLGF